MNPHQYKQKGKVLTVKSQLINVEGLMELKKSLFGNHQMITDSGKKHQWILKTTGRRFAGQQDIYTVSKYLL